MDQRLSSPDKIFLAELLSHWLARQFPSAQEIAVVLGGSARFAVNVLPTKPTCWPLGARFPPNDRGDLRPPLKIVIMAGMSANRIQT